MALIERPEDAPSGLPDDGPEAPPLGVPETERREGQPEEEEEDVSLPGIPREDDPPMTG